MKVYLEGGEPGYMQEMSQPIVARVVLELQQPDREIGAELYINATCEHAGTIVPAGKQPGDSIAINFGVCDNEPVTLYFQVDAVEEEPSLLYRISGVMPRGQWEYLRQNICERGFEVVANSSCKEG